MRTGDVEFLVEINHKIGVAQGFIVGHGNVARSLVGHVHLMALIHEPLESAAHGNDVVVRMRAENQAAFLDRIRAFGAVGVVGVGFAAGPARNGVLQPVEHVNVGVVALAVLRQQIAQAIVIVILVGQFQHGLAGGQSQVGHGFLDHRLVPGHIVNEPRGLAAREFHGRRLVYHELHIRVALQVRCRQRLHHRPLHRLIDNARLVFAPGNEHHPLGIHDLLHTQRNGAARHIGQPAEINGGIHAGGLVKGHQAGA